MSSPDSTEPRRQDSKVLRDIQAEIEKATNPQLLKSWINRSHPFRQTPTSLSPYLFKARWTEDDLRDALDYALARCKEAQRILWDKVSEAAQHPAGTGVFSAMAFGQTVSLEMGPNTVPWQFLEPEKIRDNSVELAEVDANDQNDFRRTIVGLCKVRERLESHCEEVESEDVCGWCEYRVPQ